MPQWPRALRALCLGCLLFAAIGAGGALVYLPAKIPVTEEFTGVVAFSELRPTSRRRQEVEFTFAGSEQHFVYGYPFLDAKAVAQHLRPGSAVTVIVARGDPKGVWGLTVNGRSLHDPQEVLGLHREKGLGGLAIALVSLAVFVVLWRRRLAKPIAEATQ